jgi:ribose transport system ATP-binding protein
MPLLGMSAIAKRFGPTVALQGVDLSLQTGEVHALVGENGAGKSTLMKVLSGALPPDGGTMLLAGEPYRPRQPLEARRAGVAMIYQELSLAPHLSVADNIMLGLEPTRWGLVRRREVRTRVRVALAQLGRPDLSPETLVGRLSPAAQQLTEIARALVSGCRVLVLDEPTSSLTQSDVSRLFDLIRRLRADGLGIIYISHFIEEVKQIADRVTVLRDGHVAGSGAAAELSPERIVRLMVGREVADLYPRSPRTPGEVVLETQDLVGDPLPAQATMELRRGEVLGIAGLVGSGRTELLRTLFGLDAVRAGRVRLATYAGPASPLRRWQQGCGYLSEDRKGEGLALAMSVADNMTLTRLGGSFVSAAHQRAAARHWAEALAIRCRTVSQPVSDLSGGNQQKVALARLLHHDADVLLLDEPTRGIDVGSKAEIYRLIDQLASGPRPAAILMVSSHLPELLGICDRIGVMARGRLLPPRPASELTEETIMLQATGQEAHDV